MVTLETKQGKVTGKIVSVRPELSEKKCVNFNAIPFATSPKFQRPKPYGRWEGTLDGTGILKLMFRNGHPVLRFNRNR